MSRRAAAPEAHRTTPPEPDPAPETRCTPERIAELRAQLANLKPPAPRSTHR